MRILALLSFLISFNVLAANYEIVTYNTKTGEKKTFVPTNKEHYVIPLDLKGIVCAFKETIIEKTVIGSISCSSGNMLIVAKVFDDVPLVVLELATPEKIQSTKTKEVVDAFGTNYTFTLRRTP